MLRSFRLGEPTTVTTDASDHAVAGVLSQSNEEGTKPVAFFSRSLSNTTRHYPAHEREFMAIVESLRHWRAYLHGQRFTVFTDHNPLEHLFRQKTLSKRKINWLESIAEYDFQIRYIRGKDNRAADALSMREKASAVPSGEELLHFVYRKSKPTVVELGHISASSAISLTHQQRRDVILQYQYDDAFRRHYENPRLPYYKMNGLLYWKHKLCIPRGPIRNFILSEVHDAPTAGHLGQDKTVSKAALRYHWPSLAADVREYVRTCPKCQRNKVLNRKKAGLLRPLQIAERKWGSVSMDFIMPLPKSRSENDAVLVCVDRLSKTAVFIPTTQQVTAHQVAYLYTKEVYRHYGAPDELISDRDPRFTSEFWEELCKILGVKLCRSTSYHPQSDGQTERMNRTLEEMIRSYVAPNNENWDEILVDLEFAYNNSLNAVTGSTPFFLNYGQHPKTMTEILFPTHQQSSAANYLKCILVAVKHAKECIAKANSRSKHYADNKRREEEFEVSDEVLLSTENLQLPNPKSCTPKFLPKYIGPFPVIQRFGKVNYKLQLPATFDIHDTFHVDRLRRFNSTEDDSRDPKHLRRTFSKTDTLNKKWKRY